MKRTSVVLSLFIMFALSSFLQLMPISVHASTGNICLADPSSTSCPSSTATFSGSVGEQLRVAVLLQGSDLINGFEMTTIVDDSILKPVGVDLTGSILSATSPPTILSECINGINPFNTVCASNLPAIPGTIEFSAGACPGCFATATSGLLFTEIYNITGSAPLIPLPFLTGCKQTSVPNTCVSLSNGTKTPVPETAQSGSFSNSSSPDFAITANPDLLTVGQGTSTMFKISVTSVSGFSGQVRLSIPRLFSLGWALDPTNVTLAPGQTVNSTLTVFALAGVPLGNYVGPALTATNGSITHSLAVGVTVILGPDFNLVPNTFALSILAGDSTSFAVTVVSIRGFAGIVRLVSLNRTGLTISPNFSNVTLASGGNVSTTLSVTTSPTTRGGFYRVDVTGYALVGNADVAPHEVSLGIFVESFVVSATMPQLIVNRGTPASSNLALNSVGGFAGIVNISISVSPGRRHAPGLLLSTSIVSLSPNMTSLVSFAITTDKSTRPGTYLVRVTCSNGSIVASTNITLVITP